MPAPAPFSIAYARWFTPLATVLGTGPRRSILQVDGATVTVRMGWAFSATIPLDRVVSVERSRPVPWAIGVHTAGRGDWIVNGTAGHLVELRLDPPVGARVLGVPVSLRRLRVSVDRPDEFVTALTPGT